MLIFRTSAALREYLITLPSGCQIGLVATMGALHRGHLSLVKRSLQENQITVCSIYINPTQFNDSEDLLTYPRTEKTDLKVLGQVGCQVVFIPQTIDLYPHGTDLELQINFRHLSQVMEGLHRPNHFSGVAVVMAKLFNITRPQKAYFGEKDYQQYLIIKYLARELNFEIEIIPCSTVREPSGLALSSRNQKLSQKARTGTAPLIYKILVEAKTQWQKGLQVDVIKAFVKRKFDSYPDFTLEYFEISAAETLKPITSRQSLHSEAVVFCIAVFLEGVRLIDNLKS